MGTAQPESEAPSANVLAQSRGGPTVLRILLGTQLRRLRTSKGITREDAGYTIRASHAKISRLELGQVSFKERDVADLLTLYGVTSPEERTTLLTLAHQANTPGWWHKYSDVLPSWFEVYVGLEEAASVIRTYELQFVPGLLQSEEYAHAVITLAHGSAPAEEIDHRVRLRMARQERLTGPDAPRLWAVVDEAALRRPLGGVSAMRTQLEHLIEMAALPNVTLQIVPFNKGGHAAAGGPFSILRFTADLPDVVYMEQLTSALYFDKPEDTDHYMAVMDRLCLEAAPAYETKRYLDRILGDLR
ncbi:MAG: helix-turn-helix transcriptional regulator [Nocardiopsaceae bacterium]|nr:helix-turn-helix transcriptional regulator [Nocardiopsaceae bacterium]